MTPRRGATSLDRDAVIAGAVELADEGGVDPLTMRRLAEHLGTKPMTLYGHVDNKDDLLDGMVDHVFARIDPPPTDQPWRDAVRHRCVSARKVLSEHPWAVPLLESRRSPGMATLAHHEAMLACLFNGGLTVEVVAHAYAVLDAFVFGFAIQEASLPGESDEEFLEAAEDITEAMPIDAFPHLARVTAEHVMQPGYSFGLSFDVGLDLILDGIEHLADVGEPEDRGTRP